MQVRVTLDPTGRMGLTWSLETDTDNGAGTGGKKKLLSLSSTIIYLHAESTERVAHLQSVASVLRSDTSSHNI